MFKLLLRIVITHVLFINKVTAFTTRSYDLEVPGSKPIRIIEADHPLWDSRGNDYKHRIPEFEHRTLQPTTLKTDKIMDREDIDYEDNSHNLKDFLNKYNDKNKHTTPYEDEGHDELYLKNDNISTESNEDESTEKVKPEKSKSWNLLHYDKHPSSATYSDKKGWVSMEAVPWSMSKISKWHSKPNTNKFQNSHHNRPGFNDRFHDYDRPDDLEYGVSKPSFSKPHRPTSKPHSYYSSSEEEEDDELEEEDDNGYYSNNNNYNNNYNNNNNKRPQQHRPSATYGQKVHVNPVHNYGSDNQKPSWAKRPHKHDNKCNHQSDIITDGLPPNFPDHNSQEYSNRRRGANSDFLPATHPFKGDGEWVLLSTTKGYKYPKNRQRSMKFSSPNRDNIIDSHKSVRLTVLPPLNDGKVNMTTSHGGLLQVESTFQSVDDAQRAYAKKQKLKNRNQIRKPAPLKVRPISTSNIGYQPVPYEVERDRPDTSSVLAAVGAGMIPAGMALLVPMAMGRKRRELFHRQNSVTSSPYTQEVEITLPRSL